MSEQPPWKDCRPLPNNCEGRTPSKRLNYGSFVDMALGGNATSINRPPTLFDAPQQRVSRQCPYRRPWIPTQEPEVKEAGHDQNDVAGPEGQRNEFDTAAHEEIHPEQAWKSP